MNERVKEMLLGKASTNGDAFSAVSLEQYIAANKHLNSEAKRHAENAQRRERSKWLGCGPESWCPEPCECDPCPDGEGNGVGGNTFINTTFTGDAAVKQLAELLSDGSADGSDDGSDDGGAIPEPPPEPPPVQPQPIQPIQPPIQQPDRWLGRLLWLLLGLGALLGGLLVLAYWLFMQEPTQIIAVPYVPPNS